MAQLWRAFPGEGVVEMEVRHLILWGEAAPQPLRTPRPGHLVPIDFSVLCGATPTCAHS